MATRADIESTYNYMDKMFRTAIGESADISCALFNGDFSKTLEQAQRDKHEYILDNLRCVAGSRILDIGCGWGPMLNAIRRRGAHGVGVTLSTKQMEACKRNGFEVYIQDWREMTADTFGKFDGVSCVGAFEHFCSAQEYLAGQQEAIYDQYFKLVHSLLPEGGRLFLQIMMWGKNAPKYEDISLNAPKDSPGYVLAMLERFYPGSWLPAGEEQVIQVASPYFKVISLNNGRRDYIETFERWSSVWQFNLPKLWAGLQTLRYAFIDKDFLLRVRSLRSGYNKECFKREIMDHQRIVFEKV
jgi:cyclopropane-fatty-acyl-phospholipid synthase